MLIVTTPKGAVSSPQRSPQAEMQEVCRTSNLEIDWGYAKQVEIVSDDRSSSWNGLRLSESRCR